MNSKGIRILEKRDNVISVKFTDILGEIQNGDQLKWAILALDVISKDNEGPFILSIEGKIGTDGIFILKNWEDLIYFSNTLEQEIDLTIIGSKEKQLLHRYKTDIDMYETCDVVIEMIDSSYWEIFSKDIDLINRLAKKFNPTIFLEPDFER